MTCPVCSEAFDGPPLSCPACGIRLGLLDERFGVVPWHRPGVTDTSGLISDRELADLERWAHYFQVRFPQSSLSIFVKRLGPQFPLRAYSFWLFNRGAFAGPAAQFAKNCNVLLTIDPTTQDAALTVGYGLEPFLSEEDLRAVLERSSAAFRAGRLARGASRCIHTLAALLRRNIIAAGGGVSSPRFAQLQTAGDAEPY